MQQWLRRLSHALLVLPVFAPPMMAQVQNPLVGLRGFETDRGTSARGEVLLSREAGVWHLRVAGFETTAEQTGDTVYFTLPGGRGALRVAIRSRAAQHTALWIQQTENGSYALPVRLTPAGASRWRGNVVPLDQRFSLYLDIRAGDSGELLGRFRNPEGNFGRGRVFRVTREGTSVVLTDRTSGRRQFVQPYDSTTRAIAFDFGTGTPLMATPRALEDAPGFVARTPATGPYRYRVPAALDDGWKSSSASAQGMNEDTLVALVQRIIGTTPTDDRGERVHGIVVARHGRIVLDEYFYGYSADQLHDLRSASKTMTSIMLGVAMRRGRPIATQTKVTPAGATVGQLLTHTSGLACDDNDDASPGNEEVMQSQSAERDWLRYAMRLPQAHPPGSAYAYCSAGINLVGGAIAAADGRWLPLFFEEELARPLGIARFAMNLMPTGEAYSGGGLHLRPRDLLKFGQMYLDGGVWRGRRIVDKEWVDRSTRRQQTVADGADDGFAWHLQTLEVGGRRIATYQAGGNGGQILTVIPSLDLVVALTAGLYGEGRWLDMRQSLIGRYVAGSVTP